MESYHRSVETLLSLSIYYIIDNLKVYATFESQTIKSLPEHIKNRIMRRFTRNSCLWKELNFKSFLSVLIHSRTRFIDLTSAVVDSDILQIFKNCSNLTYVYLTKIFNDIISTDELLTWLPSLNKLYLLQISYCTAVNDEVLAVIAANCPNLAYLDVSGCTNISQESPKQMSEMGGIIWISFSHTEVNNEGVRQFVSGKSGSIIKELRLADCKNVTGDIFNSIMNHCPSIEVLVVDNCHFADQYDEDYFSYIRERSLKKLKHFNWTVSW